MPSNLDGNDESRNFLFQMKILAAIGCFLILLFSLRYGVSPEMLRILGVGLLLAGAALLSGFLLGFIFTIPRVGGSRGKDTTAPTKGDPTSDSGAQPDSVPFNANLVEISDWLTKIIVGVGLVELKSIASNLGTLSYYLGVGLRTGNDANPDPILSGQTAGMAILIFYFTLGFLLGSVWTMIGFRSGLEQQVKQLEQQNKTEQRRQQTANSMISAEASVSLNQLDEAMTTIDKALENDPQNGFAVMTKARILKRQAVKSIPPDQDKLKQAIACADQAIALLPNKGEAIYNKACYQAQLDPNGLRKEVLANLEAAFRLNPGLRKVAIDDHDLVPLKQDADFIKLMH
jgi:hypothetical protein